MTYIYLKNLISKTNLFAFLIFAGLFGIYTLTATPQAVGLHSSDYLIYLTSQGTVIPSPGYPLLSFLFYINTSLFGNLIGVAYAAHLLNAFFVAVSASLVFLIVQNLYNFYQNESKYVLISTQVESLTIASFVAILFGVSNLVWRYAVFAERFGLSVLLVTLSLFFLIKILINQEKTENKLNWIGLMVSLGLGISHQWIFVGLGILILFFCRQLLLKLPKPILGQSLVAFFISLILPFGWLYLAVSNQVEYSQILPQNLSQLAIFISQNYLGDGYARAESLETILDSASMEIVISNLIIILKLVIQSFNWLILLTIPAIFVFGKKNKQLHLPFMFSILLLGLGILLALVFDWQANLLDFPEVLPQLLVLHPLIAILIWFGIFELLKRFGNAGIVLTKPKYIHLGFISIFVISLSSLVYFRFPYLNLNDKVLAGPIARNTLDSIEPNSLLACFTDFSCYSLIYQQKIEGVNPEVVILPYFYLPSEYYFEASDLQTFDYDYHPMVMFDILTSQRYQRPIYTVDMFEEYFSIMGIDYGFFYSIPLGYYNKLTNDQVEEFPQTSTDFSQRLTDTNIASWDLSLQKNKLETVKRHLFNASIYMKSNQRILAQQEVNLATTMAYELDKTTATEISKIRQNIESINPRSYFELGTEAVTPEYVLEQVDNLVERGLLGRAIVITRGAITLDHTNIPSRLKLAQLLEQAQASESAIVEYNNVLQLDPDNQTAKERLEYQEGLNPEKIF